MAGLMLVDAPGLWFRSFYALPRSLSAPDGTPVNAVRGTCDMLARLITDHEPSRLVAALDDDWRPAFRVQLVPSYKTHRVAEEAPPEQAGGVAEAEPDELSPQIPVILDLFAALGIPVAAAPDLEADDAVATLAARESTDEVLVITGDRDLFQLVRDPGHEPNTPGVRVLYIGAGLNKAKNYGAAELATQYGLPRERAGAAYAEMATLRGDPSDGLPGVAGIGEKTAAKLISQFGSLNALFKALDDSQTTVRQRAALSEARDYLAAASAVVTAVRDAPIVPDDLDDRLRGIPDEPRARELQREWNLGSSVDRLAEALRRLS